MSGLRQRPNLRRPVWIIALLSLVSFFLVGVYLYPPRTSAACYIFSSGICTMLEQPPLIPSREFTDEEIAARVVIRDILNLPIQPKNPKIAFMFLIPASLPFEKLWHKFFYGHEDRFSVYIHASSGEPVHVSPYFVGREVRSDKVSWGKISMVDAEKRLLENALLDPDNQQFVLLSDSCVPLHNFEYVYNYLMFTNISFIDSFEDPGPHGNGRYSEHMLPEVEKKDFRKGEQWFSMKRQHALVIMVDSLYYKKFKRYCKPNMDGRNCYANEHYLPTLFSMVDPGGIANWSVTHVDWSEGKWHPRAYRAEDVTYELLKNIASIDENAHVTSDAQNGGCWTRGLLLAARGRDDSVLLAHGFSSTDLWRLMEPKSVAILVTTQWRTMLSVLETRLRHRLRTNLSPADEELLENALGVAGDARDE